MPSPYMKSVVLTTLNTAYQLSVLLSGLAHAIAPPRRATFLYLEFDLAGAGNVYIGNKEVDSTHCGVHLVPTQGLNFYSLQTSDLINLDDVWLMADTNAQQINVTMTPFGG